MSTSRQQIICIHIDDWLRFASISQCMKKCKESTTRREGFYKGMVCEHSILSADYLSINQDCNMCSTFSDVQYLYIIICHFLLVHLFICLCSVYSVYIVKFQNVVCLYKKCIMCFSNICNMCCNISYIAVCYV